MIFMDIQARLTPEFTIVTKVLDKPRISKGAPLFEIRALKIEPGKIWKSGQAT